MQRPSKNLDGGGQLIRAHRNQVFSGVVEFIGNRSSQVLTSR